jgi:hypothetical protein
MSTKALRNTGFVFVAHEDCLSLHVRAKFSGVTLFIKVVMKLISDRMGK